MLLEDVLPVQEQDSLMSSHPVVVTVSTPAEITSVFDGISYSKVGDALLCFGPSSYLVHVQQRVFKKCLDSAVSSRKERRTQSGLNIKG